MNRMLQFLITGVIAFSSYSLADTVVIHGETDNSLTKEAARQIGENWDDQKALRKKVNQRAAKEFDKFDKAIDDKDKCNTSDNINVYWEENTRRCLDVTTGKPIY